MRNAKLGPSYAYCARVVVEGCLVRIGEDDPDEEQDFRDLREDGTQREMVIESLKADCEVRVGRPPGFLGG
jgi:hypothetical protein